MGDAPVVLRRRLGKELRTLRSDLGLTLEQVSSGAGVAASTLSRHENGQSAPKPRDFTSLIDFYQEKYRKAGRTDLTPERVRELRELREKAARRGWWSSTFGVSVPDWYVDYVSLEMAADRVRIFHFLIPGLFQTREYATAVIAANETYRGDVLDRIVAVRESRQQRIGQPGFAVEAVMDEGALYRQVGSRHDMRQQTLRLIELATMPTVEIRVLPYDQGACATAVGSGFCLLEIPDEAPVAYLEHYAVGHYVEGARQADAYKLAFDRLIGRSLARAESIAALARASETWA